MKRLLLILSLLTTTLVGTFLACEKPDPIDSEPLARRGGGRGKPKPIDTTVQDSLYRDSLFAACGMAVDTVNTPGFIFPTVTLTNLQTSHVTRYSTDSQGNLQPYDVLIITFDPVAIPGRTVNCYMLLADQCTGSPTCNYLNGLQVDQITVCNPTPAFGITVGWYPLNPYQASYTGIIQIGTAEGCLYASQPFTFTPPRIL